MFSQNSSYSKPPNGIAAWLHMQTYADVSSSSKPLLPPQKIDSAYAMGGVFSRRGSSCRARILVSACLTTHETHALKFKIALCTLTSGTCGPWRWGTAACACSLGAPRTANRGGRAKEGQQGSRRNHYHSPIHITLRVNLEGTHVGAINLDVLFVVRLIIVVLWSDVAAQDTAST